MEEGKEAVPPAEKKDEHQEHEEQDQQQVPPGETKDEPQEHKEFDRQEVPPQEHEEEGQQQVPPAETKGEHQEKDDQAQFPPEVVFSASLNIELRLTGVIGTADNGIMKVYKAHCTVREGNDSRRDGGFFGLKVLHAVRDAQHWENLFCEFIKNDELQKRDDPHENINGVLYAFTENRIGCIAFRCMEGSLRSMMQSKSPDGIPREYMMMILKQALKGLCFLHKHGRVHGHISAGQIFYKGCQVSLSFAATIYDHGTDDNDDSASGFLPVNSISIWGSAPEIYGSKNNRVNNTESDIWMLGVTALELAFGQPQIRDRDHFVSIVKMIETQHRLLPLRGDPDSLLSKQVMAWFEDLNSKSISTFEQFVWKCLATDPQKRPTALELLESQLFSEQTNCALDLHPFFQRPA